LSGHFDILSAIFSPCSRLLSSFVPGLGLVRLGVPLLAGAGLVPECGSQLSMGDLNFLTSFNNVKSIVIRPEFWGLRRLN
jgi:hypothetical protein